VHYLEELKRYVGFAPEDAARLRRLHEQIAPELAAVADHFYEVLAGHEGARAVLTDGPAQLVRLRQTLIAWLASGLTGPHDEIYYERRSRIGRRHVVIGLPQQYMFTAMNVMRRDLHRLIERHVTVEQAATDEALDKLLDIELAIMLRHYQLEVEERLVRRERHAQLERLTAMQTLSAGLAHEVRNPLNAAKLQLELLERRLRRTEADPRLLQAAELVHQEIGRLTLLLNDFLTFARPAELASAPTDIVTLVGHVVELEAAPAAERDVTITIDGTGAPIEAEVDSAKIHQVVQNIVRNAIEASPAGGQVAIAVEAVEGGVAIRVRDQGPGIPPEVLARMCEPFFSTKEGGTGLGMAIVHSLVTLHGGTLDVRSTPGAELVVTLPRRR
jgi:signal transduction histidine kinase